MLETVAEGGLQEAVAWAADLHQGQWRDGADPVPYLCHPLEVLTLVRYVGRIDDGAVLCSAVLHDVVEATEATLADVRSRFGSATTRIVKELTRTEPTASQMAGLSPDEVWALRSRMLLKDIGRMGPEAGTVKLADRISNLREARHAKRGKKLDRYVDQTWRILDTVPKSVNPGLWTCLKREASEFGKRKGGSAVRG